MSPIREVSSVSQAEEDNTAYEESKRDRTEEERKSSNTASRILGNISTHLTNLTEEGKAPHRHGVPMGAETSSLNMSGYDGDVQEG